MGNLKPIVFGENSKTILNCLPWGFFLNNLLLCKTNMAKLTCKLIHHKRLGNTLFIGFPFEHSQWSWKSDYYQ